MKLVRGWLAAIVGAFRRPNESAARPDVPVSQSGPRNPAEAVRSAPTAVTTIEPVASNPAEEIRSTPTAVTAIEPVAAPHHDDTSRPKVLAEPDQGEIRRRRDLVRASFNDYWSGRDDKPASFVDRLDEAQNYINDRLSTSGEGWQLDAEARATLSLPVRTAPGADIDRHRKALAPRGQGYAT